MRTLWRQTRSYPSAVQLLMANQFAINLGFYMLMPYLADHLAHGLGLAAWAVGLVLGVRNLSQQGMFLMGGTLADRYGCKPMILAGCALRTVAFILLALVSTLPALIIASALTGLAGALFNPAVRAYLAAEAGEDNRVEAFAVFNVFYQAGILVGPLAGLVLLGWDFRVVCLASAAIFGLLAVLQSRALPARPPAEAPSTQAAWRSVAADWRTIAANRPFLLFALAMTGSYVLAFQVYLALPLRARELFGEHTGLVTGAVFGVSALAALTGQVKLTSWAKRNLAGPQAIVYGLMLMGIAFVPLLPGLPPGTFGTVIGAVGLALCAALLAWGGALLYPFEMDTIVRLAGERLVATHYGAYNTACGIAVSLGNLAVGALFDTRIAWLPWAAMAATGLASACAMAALHRSGRLAPRPAAAGLIG